MYEEIEHTADLAIRIKTSSFSDLWTESGKAIMSLSGIVLADEIQAQEVITLDAEDPETLLVLWLEELLYMIEVNHVGYKDCQVDISGKYSLHATVSLAPITSIQRIIKAVTFHDLAIEEVDSAFETVIVFDV